MLKINKAKFLNLNKELLYGDVLIFFFCFFIGVILGTSYIRVYGINQNFDSELFAGNTWFASFIDSSKYLLLIFLLAFTAFGKIAIPSVFLINGFSLSEYIASAIAVSGLRGSMTAVAHLGIRTACFLPVLLIFSTVAVDVSVFIFNLVFSKNRTIKTSRRKSVEFIIIFCIAITTVFLLSFVEVGITSVLVKYISNPL